MEGTLTSVNITPSSEGHFIFTLSDISLAPTNSLGYIKTSTATFNIPLNGNYRVGFSHRDSLFSGSGCSRHKLEIIGNNSYTFETPFTNNYGLGILKTTYDVYLTKGSYTFITYSEKESISGTNKPSSGGISIGFNIN